MKGKNWTALCISTCFAPAVALAHPGHGASFAAGVLHPLSGLDHLATMLAIGLWAAQLGTRLRRAVPASFMAVMLAGACVGLIGGSAGGFGMSDQIIAASLLLLGMLIAASARLPFSTCLLLAGGFAFFHGYAHGAEAPSQAAAAPYLAGMLITSATLHLVGLGLGRWLEQQGVATLTRWLGGAVAITGIALLAT
jgi:urease accessory protein